MLTCGGASARTCGAACTCKRLRVGARGSEPRDPEPAVAAARDAAGRLADVPNIAGSPRNCTYRKAQVAPRLRARLRALTAIARALSRSADMALSNRSSILI